MIYAQIEREGKVLDINLSGNRHEWANELERMARQLRGGNRDK